MLILMDLINSFGRVSSGFSSNPLIGLGQAQGSLHFSGIRASRIRFGPTNQVEPRRGATVNGTIIEIGSHL